MDASRFLRIPLAVVLAGICARGQGDAAHHSFGCSTTQAESVFDAELNHPSKLRVVAVTSSDEIEKARGDAAHTIYSKIDAGKYPVSRVDFFIHQGRPKDPEDQLPYSSLTIYFQLTSRRGTSWWKVVEDDKGTPDEAFLSADVYASEDGELPAPVSIVPATGDRQIPLFDLQWSRQETGTSTASVEAHLLLDLRSQPPTAAADLACNAREFFGACGVWDNQQQNSDNYECDWAGGDADFRCEETTWNSARGRRESKAWFQLISGKQIPFAVPAGSPATLVEFARLAERDPAWRTRQAELPGLGKVSELLRLDLPGQRSIHFFATFGDREPFGARFFDVILSQEAFGLAYIPATSIFETDPDKRVSHQEVEFQRAVAERQALPTPSNQIETGTNLGFHVKELLAAPTSHIYQITATEAGGRNGHSSHAVYWLAVEIGPSAETFIDLAKLASDVSSYAQCGDYSSENFAAGISLLKGANFAALIDAEPSHKISEYNDLYQPPDTENGEKLEDQCPYSIRLEWSHKRWVTSDRKSMCGAQFSPRLIDIGDDGTLRPKPGEVQTPDPQ